MSSLFSLTHFSAIAGCRTERPTAVIVLAMGTGLRGKASASQRSQHRGQWQISSLAQLGLVQWIASLNVVIGSIQHQCSFRAIIRTINMVSGNVVPMFPNFTLTGGITLGTAHSIEDLADELNIRESFEYLVNLGSKSDFSENSDPRQPTSGRYRLSPLPA